MGVHVISRDVPRDLVCDDCGKREVAPMFRNVLRHKNGKESTYCTPCFERRYGTRDEQSRENAAIAAAESREVDKLIEANAGLLKTIVELRAALCEKEGTP